jgi:manganese/zinc/iron transport system permease protein
MAVMAAGCGLAVALLYKEFRLAAFDPDFGRAQGWPVGRIDLLLMTLLIAVTVVGLRAVGLILIVALVVIPPAAARFWTERLGLMVLLAGLFGGASAYLGAALSALLPDLPAGGVIVLVATALFVASLLLAPARGLLAHGLRRLALRWRIAREHLLRELLERGGGPLPLDALGQARAWPQPLVRLLARSLALGGLVHAVAPAALALTPAGRARAEALMRAHRLFEHYLVKVAGQPPVTADRGADLVEHALSAELLGALEGRLARTGRDAGWLAEPPSAHPLPGAGR